MKSSAQVSGPTAIIRAYNALIRAGDLLGLTTPEVCPDRLREQAERTTGLSHWGDSPFQASLESVVRSAQEGPALTPMGRLALRKMMRRSLVNKLLLEDLARNATEQFQVPVVRPVFIVGWYRSGTTLLHRLLAGMNGFRACPAGASVRWRRLRSPGYRNTRRRGCGPRALRRTARRHSASAPRRWTGRAFGSRHRCSR